LDANLRFLKAFKPDGEALLRRISAHIDDATLELIAKEDPVGGKERRAIFMNVLREIRAGGILKRQSDFGSWDDYRNQDVTELLQFSSYAEPGKPDEGGYGDWSGPLGHWARAFSCAVLLRSYGDYEIRCSAVGDYNYAMMQLLESIRRLDMGFEPQAMSALAWLIMTIGEHPDAGTDDRDQFVFAGVGILSLAVNSKNMISYDSIIELTDWLIAEEQRVVNDRRGPVGNHLNHWLLRTTSFDTKSEKWIAIGAELAAFKANGPCGDAVRGIGQRLSGEKLEP
jgi:hypothetical protein